MNHFFENDEHPQGEMLLWLAEEPPLVNQSAFVSYKLSENSLNITRSLNINKRMIEFLKKNARISNEKERAYKHMINERMRRDKQKKNYQALHKLLPLGTKGDKSSIIQTATKRIEELQKCKKELRRQNDVLDMRLQQNKNNNVSVFTRNGGSGEVERADIRLNVVCPNSSGLHSMLEVLKCLKSVDDTKAIAIQSSFSTQKLSARLEIESKFGAVEVEKALNATLFDVGKWEVIPINNLTSRETATS